VEWTNVGGGLDGATHDDLRCWKTGSADLLSRCRSPATLRLPAEPSNRCHQSDTRVVE
jgi:hypothetical protein